MKLTDTISTHEILWVDDLRNPPSTLQCDIARNYNEAVNLLNIHCYETIYLDHDLGDYSGEGGREKTGYDVLLYIVQRKMDGMCVPSKYHLLTANPVGFVRLKGVIDRYLS